MILGIDVGGTFTDATLVADGHAYAAKAPTTPGEESVGVMHAIREALEAAGVPADQVSRFGHGMTVGTNALLQERGARTALLTTAGFTDVIEIGRQDRPSLYRLQQARPVPLVDPEMRFGVRERCGPGGVVEPLTEAELERAVGEVVEARPEAVAISLLFSYLDPSHEERLANRLAEALPGVPVSRSSALLAQFREYERTSTTVIDAYLAPLLARYLETLRENAAGIGLPEPLIMRSSGGLLPLGSALGSGAWSVLSGPAAGAVGASLVAEESGDGEAIGFDMGGTSCDACVIRSGRVLRTDASWVAGRPIQLPMVDVHTVGAGGGSIAWRDAGGVLRVGPRSAGAEPGPACYGKGGLEPTVTDANVLLGRLPARADLPGGMPLDGDAAEAAIRGLAAQIGMGPIEAALGIIRVASREMAGAIRTITVERGLDPRSFALLSFGGAGPLHAADVATELGIERIICPRDGGTLSALGLCAAPERYDAARSLITDCASLSAESLERERMELATRARGGRPLGDDEIETTYAMRYRGQSFELEIPASDVGTDPVRLRRGFESEHDRLYGHTDPAGTVELVTMRVAVKRPPASLSLAAPADEPARPGGARGKGVASVELGEGPVEARVLPAPGPGKRIAGPAIVLLPGSTLLVPPTWSALADRSGSIVMRCDRDAAPEGPGTREEPR